MTNIYNLFNNFSMYYTFKRNQAAKNARAQIIEDKPKIKIKTPEV